MLTVRLLTLFFLCTVVEHLSGQVIIEGKIVSNTSPSISLFTPIQCFYNLNNNVSSVTIKPDEKKSFKYKFYTSNDIGFINIRIDDVLLYFAVEKNDSIKFIIDINRIADKNNLDWLKVYGSNASGHILINNYFLYPLNKYGDIYNFFDSLKSNLINTSLFIKKIISQETAFLDSLRRNNSVSVNFFNLLKKTIQINLADEFLKPFLRPSKVHKIFPEKKINLIIDSVFSLYNPLDSITLSCINGVYYVTSYLQQLEKLNKGYQNIFKLKDSTLHIQSDITLKISDSYIPFLYAANKREQEYLWGYSFSTIARIFPESITKSDIDAFSYFFPKSIYLNEIQAIYERMTKGAATTRNNKIIIDTLGVYNTLSDLFKDKFWGKKIYVDLWATWCIPCKNEFSYNEKIDPILKKNKMERLYISFDDPSSTETWKRNINSYNLEGYHIMVNSKLKEDILKRVYGNGNSYSIPKYLVVDTEGNILLTDAPRPSNPQANELLIESFRNHPVTR